MCLLTMRLPGSPLTNANECCILFNWLLIRVWLNWPGYTECERCVQSVWTKGNICSTNSNKNWGLRTLSKDCDVTWTEKCKQTSADSSISPVPFVLNIDKQCNIKTLVSKEEILRELMKYCEVLFYSLKKYLYAAAGNGSLHLICQSSAAQAAHTDPNISNDSIHVECMLTSLDTNSTIWHKLCFGF